MVVDEYSAALNDIKTPKRFGQETTKDGSMADKIIKLMKKHPKGLYQHEIAKELDVKTVKVRAPLYGLKSKNIIIQKEGKYYLN